MRSTVVAAAFAAGALAVPYEKRAVVTDVDVVYATAYVTVTAGQEPATSAAPVASSSTAAHYGHHHSHWWNTIWSSAIAASSSTSEAAPTKASSTYVPPPPSSTYVAPTTSEAPSSTYVAPSSTYVAPSSYSAPAYSAPASSAPASSAPAPSAPASSASGAEPTSYSGIAVLHHNIHRANHSAPDLAWDDGLASTAGEIAASCVYAHDTSKGGGGYGQNIAAGVEPANISAIITDLFYNGEVGWYDGLYGQAQPDMTNFEHWGHFSQIVWKDTTHVGCATQHCSNGLANVGSDVAPYFTVCNYKNPGQ